MNLLVDLFNNSKILKQVNRRISYIKNIPYKLSSEVNKSDLVEYCRDFTNDFDYVANIQYCVENPRNCFSLLGTELDTHFSIEAMNVSSRARDYVVVYSLESLLPLVLSVCCGADPGVFKKVNDIDKISRSILELDFSEDCEINVLMGLDKNLDEFLNKFLNSSDELECLSSLVSVINSTALEILKYVVCHLESYSPMVILATDKSKVVLSSSIDKVEPLEIVFSGYKYVINPFITDEIFGYYRSQGKFRYLDGYYKIEDEVNVV